MNGIKIGIVIVLALFALVFSACAPSSYKPCEYQSDRELKPGPGLFTGEKGTWTIYRKTADEEPMNQGKEKKERAEQ